jgi:hypothetical protein
MRPTKIKVGDRLHGKARGGLNGKARNGATIRGVLTAV